MKFNKELIKDNIVKAYQSLSHLTITGERMFEAIKVGTSNQSGYSLKELGRIIQLGDRHTLKFDITYQDSVWRLEFIVRHTSPETLEVWIVRVFKQYLNIPMSKEYEEAKKTSNKGFYF